MRNKLEDLVTIAENFEKLIKGKSFGFSENLDSSNKDIVRYEEGIRRIYELTGVSVDKLEETKEINVDDGLIDVRFKFEDILFEYSFPDMEFDDEIDKENGWWKIWHDANGSIEDISVLYDKLYNHKTNDGNEESE